MDPFEELQNTIQQVLPIVLLGPGVVLTGSGLFMWLGGLRWLKAIAAFAGALAGMVCAWYFTERQLVPLVLLPVILAALGIYFNKAVVVVLGAGLGALLVLFVPVLVDFSTAPHAGETAPPTQQPMDLLESIEWVQAKIATARDTMKEMVSNIPASRKTTASVTAGIICVLGFFSWRLVCAATCSVLGTTLILCGMTVLMLYKGRENLERMLDMRYTLGLAVVGMVIGGVLIQLLLCPAKPKKITKDDIKKQILEGD